MNTLWRIWDSNPPPIDCEPIALPDELIPQGILSIKENEIKNQVNYAYSGVYKSA